MDKIYHFGISLLIAIVIFALASDYVSEIKSGLIAFIITIVIGIGKEIYDIKKQAFHGWTYWLTCLEYSQE